MRPLVPVFFLIAPALFAAEGDVVLPKKKMLAVSLLPDGSQLHGVMFPRYDKKQRLIGVLKARAMTLINDETISGETVSIEFFNPDQSPRGRADFSKAVFYQTKGILEAREPVTIHTDRINAIGTGLIYAFEQGEGFLLGPAATWIQAPIETTMNSSSSPLRATALAGLSLLAQSAVAAPPAAVTPAEQAALTADAAPKSGWQQKAAQATRTDLLSDLESSAAATAEARAFLERTNLANPNNAAPAPPPAEAKPLDVKPGPNDTLVDCDGGMYFDADEGLFVYLRNVRVTDPRFGLSGANDLKIFLGKKPSDGLEDGAKKDKPGLGLGAKFGDVEKIVATGAVRILQKSTEAGKEPVEASGAIFVYRPKTGEIIISGGYPWVKQGANFMRAMEPNLVLRINQNGSFVTEGNWGMGGHIEEKR